MKYPAIGLITLFLRSLAETLEKNNTEGSTPAASPEVVQPSEPLTGEPTDDKPKRKRRTATEIAADEAAEAAKNKQPEPEPAKAPEPEKEEPVTNGKHTFSPELYEARRAAFEDLVKGGRLLEVKAIIKKHSTTEANKDIPDSAQAAFLADIEALKL